MERKSHHLEDILIAVRREVIFGHTEEAFVQRRRFHLETSAWANGHTVDDFVERNFNSHKVSKVRVGDVDVVNWVFHLSLFISFGIALFKLGKGGRRPRQAHECQAHGFRNCRYGAIGRDGRQIGHIGVVVLVGAGTPFEVSLREVEELVDTFIFLEVFAIILEILLIVLGMVYGMIGNHDGLTRFHREVLALTREAHDAVYPIIRVDKVVARCKFKDDARVDLVGHKGQTIEVKRLLRRIVDGDVLVVIHTSVVTLCR